MAKPQQDPEHKFRSEDFPWPKMRDANGERTVGGLVFPGSLPYVPDRKGKGKGKSGKDDGKGETFVGVGDVGAPLWR